MSFPSRFYDADIRLTDKLASKVDPDAAKCQILVVMGKKEKRFSAQATL